MSVASLELDLDVFSGPFDLLLTLVLREEIDLMELQLADVVLAYLDHLEGAGELDLESATEFIMLIAALLELKSRLLVASEDEEDLLELEPEEAAEELLHRMLDARRYRGAAGELQRMLAAEDGYRYRVAPLPKHLRRTVIEREDGVESPDALGAAIGALLELPPPINIGHITIHRVSVAERLRHLRALLSQSAASEGISFDSAVKDADRVTVAVTIFALLELYKRGEAHWRQEECFGEISIHAGSIHAGAARPDDITPLGGTTSPDGVAGADRVADQPADVASAACAPSHATADEITIRRLGAAGAKEEAPAEMSPELIEIRRVEGSDEDLGETVVAASGEQ